MNFRCRSFQLTAPSLIFKHRRSRQQYKSQNGNYQTRPQNLIVRFKFPFDEGPNRWTHTAKRKHQTAVKSLDRSQMLRSERIGPNHSADRNYDSLRDSVNDAKNVKMRSVSHENYEQNTRRKRNAA